MGGKIPSKYVNILDKWLTTVVEPEFNPKTPKHPISSGEHALDKLNFKLAESIDISKSTTSTGEIVICVDGAGVVFSYDPVIIPAETAYVAAKIYDTINA